MCPPPLPHRWEEEGGGNWKSYFFPARICPLLINPKGVITAGRIISTILYHNISCSIYVRNHVVSGQYWHPCKSRIQGRHSKHFVTHKIIKPFDTVHALQRRFELCIPRNQTAGHIHTSVSDLYTPRIGPPILLQPNRRMRSSLVVRASDCQCTSCNGPGFDPSIRRHSGI